MGIRSIIRYTVSALAFAFAVLGVCLAAARAGGKRIKLPVGLMILAVAAVVDITGLRIGLKEWRYLEGEIRPVPLETTLSELRLGWWPFLYHTAGNLLWFFPIGVLWKALSPKHGMLSALLVGAGLSLSVECLQYLLGTGISDADDILLNAAGALAGAFAHSLFRKSAVRRQRGKPPSSPPSVGP